MLSAAESNNHANSPQSQCDASASPSSLRDIDNQSRASTQEHNNNHSPQRNDDLSSDDPADFSSLRSPSSLVNISANIELHPQNDALGGGSSKQKYIKRPLNAYMIWTRQERKRILTDDPKMKMNEVSKAMGEKWKKMSDKDKKPYFELAKKYSEEHKQVLQEHPELQYAPSKKKGPKKPGDGIGQKQSVADSSSIKSCTATPDASRSTTPRGPANLIAPQPISQGNMFSSFQSPLSSSTVQLAQQVLQGVRQAGVGGQFGHGGGATNAMSNSILAPTPTFPQAFLQPQGFPQRVAATSSCLLSGISQSGANSSSNSTTTRTTPSQMLDLYYTSLCQPAFPNITENPVNPLGMYPPHYLLEQYNQQLSQQQQQQQGSGGASGTGAGTNGAAQF